MTAPRDPNDDDSLDDEEEGLLSSMHFAQHKSNRVQNYLKESWRVVENAAMRIPAAAETHAGHAVSSRLGGFTGSSRTPMTSPAIGKKGPTETTALLGEEAQKGEGALAKPPPPLLQWLWIALLCALACKYRQKCFALW